MAFLTTIRAMFATKRELRNILRNDMESEHTSGAPSVTSTRRQKVNYLKKCGKALGLHILGKLHLVDVSAEAGEVYLGRPATSSADKDIRGSIFRERYVTVRFLGRGGNGTVDLCRDTKAGTLVAVKTMHHNEALSPPNEVYILNLLGYHQNIVQYHTMLDHPTLDLHTQLVFEYCSMGDLVDYVNSLEGDVTELLLWHVFKHLAAGLDYLHRNNIVHGDIKPCNILLAAPHEGDIYPIPKLADFGTAQVSPRHDVPFSHLCTLGYQPPEAESCHGPAADIWALGCIIHEMARGHLPQQKVEPPETDPRLWFELSGKQIPMGTQYHFRYKRFCFYMTFHPAAPTRIDRASSSTSRIYSKLLNYVMMRTLDTDPRSRISSQELHHILPVLEPLVHNLLVLGQEQVLECFNEARDDQWKMTGFITDSQVFRYIFCMGMLQANREWNMEMISWCTQLLMLMDSGDQVAACQYVTDLGLYAS